MCKRLVVEVTSKARKKASVNDNSYLGVAIPQRLNCAVNGSEATTQPTYRCRQ
jgi:hypothetical protein